MHNSVSSEFNRRQGILQASGNYANVNDWNKARVDNFNLEPVPALLIVLDDPCQYPDFVDLFVAAEYLGRFLQIHLLLANQWFEEGHLHG